MTDAKVKRLVDRAIELDRAIEDNKAELTGIEDQLKAEAESRGEEHVPTAGGGWSWTAPGSDGAIVRVTREGDKLKSSVAAERDVAAIKEVCGTHFGDLFVPGVVYRPVEGIRERAAQRLLAAAAKKLIKLITGKGRTTVAYEVKEVADAR